MAEWEAGRSWRENMLRLRGAGGKKLSEEKTQDPELALLEPTTSLWERMRPNNWEDLSKLLTNLFPVWVMIAVAVGILRPTWVTWFDNNAITYSVGATMVFTGMTLTVQDFVDILQKPGQVTMGFVSQYTLMPVIGQAVCTLFALPRDIAAGVILLSCCPGGSSSNLITLIAKGDVALSVLMTTASTLLAPLVTPFLVSTFAGSLVKIDSAGLIASTLQVVIGPVGCGLVVNRALPNLSKASRTITPLLSVLLVSMICGSIIGQMAAAVLQAGPRVLGAVSTLHVAGFFVGYWATRLCGFSERVARTCAIETGIQSAALAVVLATRHFPNPILSALPCALSTSSQSILGSIVAACWHLLPVQEEGVLTIVGSLHGEVPRKRLQTAFRYYDRNRDGALSKYDVARLLLDSYKHQKDALMALGGYALVTEEGGSLTSIFAGAHGTQALRKALVECDDKIWALRHDPSIAERFFYMLDHDHDGTLSLPDFEATAAAAIRSSLTRLYRKRVH